MGIVRFPEKTIGLKCPFCGAVDRTCFKIEWIADSHYYCKTAKLECAKCGFYIEIDDESRVWSCEDSKNADTLLEMWKENEPPFVSSCKLCGKKPRLSYQSRIYKIQCEDCGVAVSGRKMEKTVESWNKLMTAIHFAEMRTLVPPIDDEDRDISYHASEDISEMYRGMTAIVWGSVALLVFVGLLVWGAIKLFS